jgi:peroxiredoxin
MAATASQMIALGAPAPAFSLPDVVSGKTLTPADVRGASATLVLFICNHCPFVKHINGGLSALARDYTAKGVGIVAISSNDAEAYPADSPDNMKRVAAEEGYTFPYLYDETQEAARAYGAVCTPDIFLYDGELRLVYRGQFDSSRPTNGLPVTGADVRAALDALLAGGEVSPVQTPAIGCNIKWKRTA